MKSEDDLVDLYRAVSPDEYDEIMKTGEFKIAINTLGAKQFGRNLYEIIALADYLPDVAAVVRIRIPKSTLKQLDLTPVDAYILKSGSVTAHEGSQLALLNRTKVGPAEHAF